MRKTLIFILLLTAVAAGQMPVPALPTSTGVSSIQPQNNGVNYGSPLTGAITMNFANCTVSATFTITCSSTGANTTLSNLGTVALNTSLLPGVAAANNLGTAPLPFGDGYFGGAANHSFHFDTSAVASNVAIAVPNANSNTVQGIANPSDAEAVNYIDTSGVQHRISVPQGTVTGTGTSTYLPYWTGTSSLGATADFTYTSGTHTLAGSASAIFDFSSASSFKPPGTGGTLTLGTANQNWGMLGTGVVINTTTTGAQTVIAASGAKCYPFQGSGGTGCDTPSGGDTITSPNLTLSIGGSSTNTTLDVVGAAGKIMAGATPALTYTPSLGVDGSSAGTLQLANRSAAFHTILGTQASSNYTFNLPPTGGTNTYVLQTDGSGNTSWTAQVGGSGSPVYTNVKDNSIKGDGKIYSDITTVATNSTIASAASNFVAGDVGKLISIPGAATPTANNPRGYLNTTIATASGAHTCTLTVAPTVSIAGTAVATFATDDTTAFNSLVTATSAPATLFFPAGVYGISANLPLKTGINVKGAGRSGATILKWMSTTDMTVSLFTGTVTDVAITDMELDGSAATAVPNSSNMKAIYSVHPVRMNIHEIYAHEFPSTCIGTDGIVSTDISNNITYACGQMNDGTGGGGAGIGIGSWTTSGATESATITNNTCIDNKRFGIFIETQSAAVTAGHFVIADNIVSAVNVVGADGIADAGVTGIVITGNHVYGSTTSSTGEGIAANLGTSNSAGVEGIIEGNYVNGFNYGIVYDQHNLAASVLAGYSIIGNRVSHAITAGIQLLGNATYPADGAVISNNVVHDSGAAGIEFDGSDGPTPHFTNVTITSNILYRNGLTVGSSYLAAGIAINSYIAGLNVRGNIAYDGGSSTQQYGMSINTSRTVSSVDIQMNNFAGNTVSATDYLSTPTGVNFNNAAPSGTGAKVQTTNLSSSTNGDVTTMDAAGNTQDSGVLLSSLGSVNPLTSWVTPGLGGAGQAMGSSGNAIYCIGQILPQPVALSSVRASSVAADATNYYGIAILSGNGATMYCHNSPGIHIPSSQQVDFACSEGTPTIPPGNIIICTTGQAATGTLNGNTNNMSWLHVTNPVGLSSSTGVITGTITTPPTAAFSSASMPVYWLHQ